MSDPLPKGTARRRFRLAAGSLIVLLALLPAARAAEQIRHEAATVTLRLLPADEDGTIRGALVVDLEPGWKTYWVAPGPVGLAPDLRFDRSVGLGPVEVDYPVPIRFTEGSDTSVGYDAPTAFALRSSATPGVPPVMRVDLLIGVCREICVPLAASLEARPDGGLSARAAVSSAFALVIVGDRSLTTPIKVTDATVLNLRTPCAEVLKRAREAFDVVRLSPCEGKADH